MKWILIILLLISASTFGQVGRGDDSTKYIRYQNQYGQRMPRSWWDSVAHMPYGDTALFPKPCRPGAIMMHTDKNFYKWNGAGWEGMGSGGGSADSSVFATKYGVDTAKVNLRTQIAGKQATGNYITALTGDVTASGPGSVAATIANNVVTNAKAAQMAAHTFKGNNTGSTANAGDLTATQLTAELNVMAPGLKGLAPAPSGSPSSTKYLSEDGTYSTPAGGSQTFPQTLATGRTFSANDSAIITNKEFKFKGGTVSSDTLDISKTIRIGTHQPVDSRLKMIVRDNSADTTSFSAIELKTTNDDSDLNVDGATIVKHDKSYLLTPGYASTLQVYTLAGSAGTIIGNNNFVGVTTPYAPGENEISNGFVRFELGPYWPKSEKMRINNRGDVIFGWTTLRSYLASQSGTTVTDPDNAFFASDVGKFFCWGERELGGKYAFADRITGYTDAHHITVETNRTIAAQGGRVCVPNAIIDTLGNALYRYVSLDSIKLATNDETAYFKLKSVVDTFRIVRHGTATDAAFDVTHGITTVRLPKDVYFNGSTYSKLHFQDATHELGGITATSSSTRFETLDDVPIDFYPNGAPAATVTSSKFQAFKPTIISGIADAPIAKLDVRNPDANISLYVENSRGTGTNFGAIIDVTASASENRAVYATATGAAVNKAIAIPTSSANGPDDFAIYSATTAKSHFAGSVGINTTTPSWGLDVQRSMGANKDSVDHQTVNGTREMLTIDTATGKFQRMPIPSSSSGITSINSKTGPAITLTGGVATYVTNPGGGNTLAYNVDPTSSVFARTIDAQYTDVSNSGTSATDIYTKSISGGTLGDNGSSLQFEATGEYNDATATNDLQVLFAGNSIAGTGAVTISGLGPWVIKGTITRVNSTTVRTSVIITDNSTTKNYLSYSNLSSLDLTTGNILKVTAQAGGGSGGTGDITGHTWLVKYNPAP